jgi:hypothetical protein
MNSLHFQMAPKSIGQVRVLGLNPRSDKHGKTGQWIGHQCNRQTGAIYREIEETRFRRTFFCHL